MRNLRLISRKSVATRSPTMRSGRNQGLQIRAAARREFVKLANEHCDVVTPKAFCSINRHSFSRRNRNIQKLEELKQRACGSFRYVTERNKGCYIPRLSLDNPKLLKSSRITTSRSQLMMLLMRAVPSVQIIRGRAGCL